MSLQMPVSVKQVTNILQMAAVFVLHISDHFCIPWLADIFVSFFLFRPGTLEVVNKSVSMHSVNTCMLSNK